MLLWQIRAFDAYRCVHRGDEYKLLYNWVIFDMLLMMYQVSANFIVHLSIIDMFIVNYEAQWEKYFFFFSFQNH